MRVPLTRSTGFPDFIVYRGFAKTSIDNGIFYEISEAMHNALAGQDLYQIIGVESKLTGELDREEKEKCKWLLANGIFGKILIARKTKVKNRVVIVYEDFKEKYWRFYK